MQGRGMGFRGVVARAVFACVVLALAVGPGLVASAGEDERSTVHSMVGEARRAAQVPAVAFDDITARVAARHSARMASAGEVFHNDRLGEESSAAGVDWDVIGENVGVGVSVEQVQRAFMASNSHRRTTLDERYTSLGVGIARSADDRIYITQIFARTTDPSGGRRAVSDVCGSTRRAEDGTTVSASYFGARCP